MEQPNEAGSVEGNAEVKDHQIETTDTSITENKKEEKISTTDTTEVAMETSTEAGDNLNQTPIPTSVIQTAPSKPESISEDKPIDSASTTADKQDLKESIPLPNQESLPSEESNDKKSSDVVPEPDVKDETESQSQPEKILNLQPPSEELPAELLDTEQQEGKEQECTVADLIEEAENQKETLTDKSDESNVTTEPSEKMDTSPAQNPKAKKSQAAKAAELEQEWDDEGDGEEASSTNDEDKSKSTGNKTERNKTVTEFTPRKSSRAPKPTEKKLESDSQKNLNTDDMEESVDAIAKELEKSDSEVKKSGKKDKSPKKGKKQQSEGDSKEDWVALIFGENGEKVTEKGTPRSKLNKTDTEIEESKAEEIGPEAEEFLEDQTPFTSSKNKAPKRGGRPRKKDLDEKLDGVAKLGSNMYFYTGPGGSADSPPSLHSDDEDLPVQKKDSEPARKSNRASKGRNPRLEREDEVVDIPQVKAPPKPNLNPSWLKNHDGKSSTPAGSKSKAVTSTPVTTKASTTPVSTKTTSKQPVEEEPSPDEAEDELQSKSTVKKSEKDSIESGEEAEKTEDAPKEQEDASPPRDEELPEFDPAKFTPGYVPPTVKKGKDEYMIVVSGVKDTGLCGGYWGNTENLGSRRRSKPVEQLQIGRTEKTPRRGSIGSVGSGDTPTNKKTPQMKKANSTPQTKNSKKQLTKPEKSVESMDSSQSESEADVDQSTSRGGRGKKRKNDDTPSAPQEKKSKTGKKDDKIKDDPDADIKEAFSDYDSGANESQPLKKAKGSNAKNGTDSPTKDAPLTSKQQTAVTAALAAGVPAGQQRSVSCVADTSTQREVVVECFAPYDDHRWVNIGKERDGMAPDAVQYARALRPPYHLLSFLRIKGHSTKGMSCTDKNTMVFVVLEGEITVILHTTQFNAKKGDSFYIPPKNYYNLINQKAREAELSLIQFQYDGPLPTVQPNSS